MREFRLPDPGEGLVEAEIVRWLVAEGDEVAVNDILVEIETSKSIVELPSPFAGRVARLLVAEGDEVAVGAPIIVIDDGSAVAEAEVADDAGSAADEAGGPSEPGATETEAFLVGYGVKSAAVARRPRKHVLTHVGPVADHVHESYAASQPVSRPIDQPTVTAKAQDEPSGEPLPDPGRPPQRRDAESVRARAKPSVRRLARDLGLDLESLVGTGPEGVVTAEDVVAAASPHPVEAPLIDPAAAPEASGDERIPLRGVRRMMAKSMTASLLVPQATAWVEADVTGTMELMETLRKRREFEGHRVSPLIVFARAACLAIGRNPDINSSLDLESDAIVRHRDVNLGIAAATPRGLMVPNIKRANAMNLVQLAQAMTELVESARGGTVSPADMARGTFTITNVGIFGIDGGTPILNQGESAIMCLGAIKRKPWVVGKGADERIEPRSICELTLTFDHRVVDGETASRFLMDVATILANPGLALLY